ncbi:ABC transporter ATP-binding protein [uncultured Desulfobacter sp.]|uniref:ABC transporter ATP-binding protein n=1 Tax=uncultured Desulfobacter sp. TaxID=240139 RepID=UPI0029F4D2EE|nr:ABC transporter ATP-binding protein [uncultured Desulfobacter sp.]
MKQNTAALIKIGLFNLLIFCLMLPTTLLVFYEPIIIKKYINNLMVGGTEILGINNSLLVSLFFMFDFILAIASIYIMTFVAKKLYFYLSDKVFLKYLNKEVKDICATSSGEVITIVNNDINAIFGIITMSVPSIMVNFLFIIMALLYIKGVSSLLLSICLLSIVVDVILVAIVSKSNHKANRIQRDKLQEKQNFIVFTHDNYIYIRANELKEYISRTFSSLNNGFYSIATKIARVGEVSSGTVRLIALITPVVCIACMVGQNSTKVYEFGDILGVQLMITNLFRPASSILNSVISISSRTASLRKIYNFLFQETSINNNDEMMNFKNSIFYKSIEDKAAFYSIEGANGSGKSSLLRTMAGLLDLKIEPDLLISKARIKGISLHGPKPFILFGSIRENICLEADTTDITKKIMSPSLSDMITRIGGEQRVLNWNGDGLSSGEKTMIEVLRIALSNKDIFLIDELSAHLDKASKTVLIEILLEKVKNGKHVYFISHNYEEQNMLKKYGAKKIELKNTKMANIY